MILCILKQYSIKATFFVIGSNAAKYPDRVKKIFDDGHEIGNHTYNHIMINTYPKEIVAEEINKTSDIIFEITGKRPVVFRPPGGAYNDSYVNMIINMGYRCVLWSVDTRDWSMPPVDKIIVGVISDTTDGDVILFHDYNMKNSPTPKALKAVIPKLLARGYEFVTISELFADCVEDADNR
ncbi:MAG: polysaccharide deacetylase family protein [Oscillospiraceae bacterium]|nr:polysaccharide deacetylase family protein [Oscillospiraceae bacterium]